MVTEQPAPPPLTPVEPAGKNVLINYFSMLGGTISAKGLAFVTVLLLTRYLGVEDFGRYSLVFSYWSLLNILVDLGTSQILVRELSHVGARTRALVESAVYLRLIGCLVFLPLGFIGAKMLGLSNDLVIAAFLGLFVGFEAFYDVFFSATMQLDKNAKARFFSSLAQTSLIGIAVLLRWPLAGIIAISMLNPLLKLALDYRYSGGFTFRLHAPDWGLIRQFLADGWPLWLIGLQYVVLTRIDTFMLQVLTPNGEHELGIYSAAFRFSEIMVLLTNTLCTTLLPLLVRRRDDPAQVTKLANTGVRAIVTLLLCLSLVIFWGAPLITKLYGPGYEASALCMRILIWSQAIFASNSLCYHLLIVYNMQGRKPVLIGNFFLTLFNIGLNFFLIPKYEALGASWATVLTELITLGIALLMFRLYTPLRLAPSILLLEGLALLACLPGWLFGEIFGWLSVPLFVGLVFGLRLITPSQIKWLASERLQATPTTPTSADTPV